jgi:exosortase A
MAEDRLAIVPHPGGDGSAARGSSAALSLRRSDRLARIRRRPGMLKTPAPPFPALSALTSPAREWALAAALLAIGVFAFAIIFYEEITAAISVWNNSDAFSHCYLVPAVAAYLAWDRRKAAMATPLRPTPALALLAIPVAAAWFVADRLGIMEARQLLAMTLFQVMVAGLFGLPMWRALSAPLLYLYFLVPFGEFLVPLLQSLAVHFTTLGLNLFGIPNFADGIVIQIPEGTFLVHQACSGLRFLIALMAVSVLYACLIYRSPMRRLLFIAVAFAVAVIGNDVRVLGIVLIAHFIGNAQAVETGHVLWGWLFYVIVGGVLVAIGLRFRQEGSPPPRINPRPPQPVAGAAVVALTLVLAIATAPRAAADLMDGLVTDAPAEVVQIDPPALAGCTIISVPPMAPVATAGDKSAVSISRPVAYRCADGVFVLTLRRYPPRIAARPLFSSLASAQMPADADISEQTDFHAGGGPDAPIWRITQSQKDGRYAATATALWVDGRPAGGGIAARVTLALNALRNKPVPPVVAVVNRFEHDGPASAGRALGRFLDRTAPLSTLAREFAAVPSRG